MDFSLRYATIQDAELVADISRKTFYETFIAQNAQKQMDLFMKEQFTKGRLMLEVGKPGNTFILAYQQDTIAGYVKLREGEGLPQLQNMPALEIARLYAVKEMIGTGVGKLLMQTSIDIAREKNKKVAWLGVWEKNQRAIDFYRKWGFEKFGEQDFHLGNEVQCDWVMKKEL